MRKGEGRRVTEGPDFARLRRGRQRSPVSGRRADLQSAVRRFFGDHTTQAGVTLVALMVDGIALP